MLFVTLSSAEAAHYGYVCMRLKDVVNKMYAARKTLEAIANASFDKAFAKCMYMLTSESLQCENEIRAQIDSMVCNDTGGVHHAESKNVLPVLKTGTVESVCRFFEDIYLSTYNQLLVDKNISASVKDLIKNHLMQFKWSLTQLRLFNDVKAVAN